VPPGERDPAAGRAALAAFARRLHLFPIGLQVALQFSGWALFFLQGRGPGFPISSWIVALLIFAALYGIVYAILLARQSAVPIWVVVVTVLNVVLLVVVIFAVLYWHYGTTPNFNVTLSRLDALYFTLGTLSTAGTGSIYPSSELARGLVSAQMAADLLLFAVAVALVVTRLGERRQTRR